MQCDGRRPGRPLTFKAYFHPGHVSDALQKFLSQTFPPTQYQIIYVEGFQSREEVDRTFQLAVSAQCTDLRVLLVITDMEAYRIKAQVVALFKSRPKKLTVVYVHPKATAEVGQLNSNPLVNFSPLPFEAPRAPLDLTAGLDDDSAREEIFRRIPLQMAMGSRLQILDELSALDASGHKLPREHSKWRVQQCADQLVFPDTKNPGSKKFLDRARRVETNSRIIATHTGQTAWQVRQSGFWGLKPTYSQPEVQCAQTMLDEHKLTVPTDPFTVRPRKRKAN